MTGRISQRSNRGRAAAAVCVLIVHGALGYALIVGLNVAVVPMLADPLKIFDVREETPPPPVQEPPAKSPARTGAASPPNKTAVPAAIMAPRPAVRTPVPPPITAAPVPGTGSASVAGAAINEGAGTGSGGTGAGTGSGGSGTGGGGGTGATLIGGRIRDSDYPRGASKARAGGTVIVRFSVEPDGRARGCKVTTSSGNAELDATTCRLIEQRFRYAPARDKQGRPMAEVKGWKQTWWLEPRG